MDSSCKHRLPFFFKSRPLTINQSPPMHQYHVVQVLVQSFGGGQAKYAHLGPHTDTGVQSHEHTNYNHGVQIPHQ